MEATAGGCDAKSESLADGDLSVVMGPTATGTQERRDGTHHDKRGQGRTSRQAHLAQESQWFRASGREEPDDHGNTGGGAWRDKSEAPPSAPGSMIPGSSQSLRLKDSRDHGSTAGGAWQNKSENPSHADQALRLVVEWTAHL